MKKVLNYDFWKSWKDITSTERKAIEKIVLARQLIIQSLPIEQLVAIYVKGSFVRREMRPESDIDIVPIVVKTSFEGNAFGANIPKIKPAVVVPLSLEEFKANRLLTPSRFSPDLRAEPDLFLMELSYYGLIYGKPLNPRAFPVRGHKQIVTDEISKIRNGYIKAYETGRHSIPPIKEVFWLVEFYQRSKGINVDHSFRGILASVNDDGHLLHQAYRLKLKGKKATLNEKRDYLVNLNHYLDRLEAEIKG